MNIGKYIKDLRLSRNLTQEELGVIVGVKRAAVQKWESGQTQNLKRTTIKILADYFGVSPASFIDDEFNSEYDIYQHDNITPIETKKIPLIGEIACGEPIAAYEEFESYVECGTDVRADFALRCKGDSMINARINNGDIVFIRKQPEVENGEIAAVVIEGDATLKRVYKKPYGLLLMAENPEYEPIMVTPEEYTDFRIVGKAVAFQSDIK